MTPFDDFTPEEITVVCPVCRCRIDVTVRDEPGKVECPDCFTMVKVPARDQATELRPRKPITEEQDGTYKVHSEEGERPARPPKPRPTAFIRLTCCQCGAELTAEQRNADYNVTCPECLDVIVVPATSGKPTSKKRKRKQKKKRPPKRAAANTDQPKRKHSAPDPRYVSVEDALAQLPEDHQATPPRWTFFSNVYLLPFRSDILSRFLYLAVSFSLFGLLAAVILWLVDEGFLLGIPFFALPVFWVTFWSVAYATTTFVTITEETANGNERITGWSDGGWREWVGDSLPTAYLASLSCVLALVVAGIVAAAAGDGYYRLAFGLTVFFTLPVMLMSSLQVGSVWVPFSTPVLKSLVKKPWAWALFYLFAGGVLACYLVPVSAGLAARSSFATLILTGPILAYAVIVIARLFGRLGWVTLVQPGREAEPGETPDAPFRKHGYEMSGQDNQSRRQAPAGRGSY